MIEMQVLHDPSVHQQVAQAVIFTGLCVFGIFVLVEPASYGKLYSQESKGVIYLPGPLLPARWCWMIFESAAWIMCLIFFFQKPAPLALPNAILLALFLMHYIHRSILYPLRMPSNSKCPLAMVAIALPYCLVNGYLQAQNLCRFQEFSEEYIYSFEFIFGLIIMLFGFSLAYHSDRTLLELRKTGTYHIPRGYAFELVSCPHFLGEILEWLGFAIACSGSIAPVSFLVWTSCILVSRALAQHKWYHKRFQKDYPRKRKAIIPYIL